MKIGILGTRGIPNAYGGFEQFAQYLAEGLVQRGHEVSVYNSDQHPYKEKIWKCVQIVHCKDWEQKIGTAGQFIYDLNCLKDARKRNFDILLQLGYTSSSIWYRQWPKTINMVNMDGLEWKRSKYNWVTRKFLRFAEKLAAKHADYLVADSPGIQSYLLKTYGKNSVYIPYGAEIPSSFDETITTGFGLRPYEYYLLVARMEPENNVETIIKGYLQSGSGFPLVIIGNAGNSFGKYLVSEYRNQNLLFKGALYDNKALNALRHYSLIYFHGHSVGGTNPSLLEAMASQCSIIAHDNNFNKAILGTDARYFLVANDILSLIQAEECLKEREKLVRNNLDKIYRIYNWDKVINQYEELFENILKGDC